MQWAAAIVARLCLRLSIFREGSVAWGIFWSLSKDMMRGTVCCRFRPDLTRSAHPLRESLLLRAIFLVSSVDRFSEISCYQRRLHPSQNYRFEQIWNLPQTITWSSPKQEKHTQDDAERARPKSGHSKERRLKTATAIFVLCCLWIKDRIFFALS